MKKLIGCALMPYSNLIVEQINKKEPQNIKATMESVCLAAKLISEKRPDTIVVLSSSEQAFEDAITISVHPRLRGSFENESLAETILGFETDTFLIDVITQSSVRLGINLIKMTEDVAKKHQFELNLQEKELLPLYYLYKNGFKGQIVCLRVKTFSPEEMYTFGKALQVAISSLNKKVAVVTIADISSSLNYLKNSGVAAPDFEEDLFKVLKNKERKELFELNESFDKQTEKCDLKQLFFLMGIVAGLNTETTVCSYEREQEESCAVIYYSVQNNNDK